MEILQILEFLGLAAFLPLLVGAVTTDPRSDDEGAELLGRDAPGWGHLRWANTLPLRLESLGGQVTLVRWFNDHCECCEATGPTLERLHHELAPEGFSVLGMYHPIPQREVTADMLKDVVGQFKFTFPVAADSLWDVLREWWLNSGDRGHTCVSFILDKNITIRALHPGGPYYDEPPEELEEGEEDPLVEDYRTIRTKIRRFLREDD